jgi:hypothetical protein
MRNVQRLVVVFCCWSLEYRKEHSKEKQHPFVLGTSFVPPVFFLCFASLYIYFYNSQDLWECLFLFCLSTQWSLCVCVCVWFPFFAGGEQIKNEEAFSSGKSPTQLTAAPRTFLSFFLLQCSCWFFHRLPDSYNGCSIERTSPHSTPFSLSGVWHPRSLPLNSVSCCYCCFCGSDREHLLLLFASNQEPCNNLLRQV